MTDRPDDLTTPMPSQGAHAASTRAYPTYPTPPAYPRFEGVDGPEVDAVRSRASQPPLPQATPSSVAPQPAAPGPYAPSVPPSTPASTPPPARAPQPERTPSGKDDGFFGALFDFSFERYVSLRWAKVVYVCVLVLNALMAMGVFTTIASASAAASYMGGGGPSGLAILFGLALSVALFIGATLVVRVCLEALIALIQQTRYLRSIAERMEK
ncbi:MAG: DUF4282 domain-containing protein [Actinomycetaceae bacterium]|nr:DUF4282 domain-containing protein [Actinomycetaceae bacterium]